MREHFMIPTAEDILSRLFGKIIFSVIDMKEGFWQLKLDEPSSQLCTFNTPFGRYKFNRLPFGICSAPEIFQSKNFEMFGDIANVDIYFDDIIVYGQTEEEHDIALKAVLDRAVRYNIKFNFSKLQYKIPQVKFLGQVVSKDGVSVHESNIEAIKSLESPTDKQGVIMILGLLKYFNKYIPDF